MKFFYIATWILLAITFLATVFADNLNTIILVALSFAVLALVYALALWSVFTNTGNIEPDDLRKI